MLVRAPPRDRAFVWDVATWPRPDLRTSVTANRAQGRHTQPTAAEPLCIFALGVFNRDTTAKR